MSDEALPLPPEWNLLQRWLRQQQAAVDAVAASFEPIRRAMEEAESPVSAA